MAAVSVSRSHSSPHQSFNDAVHHALLRLEMSHLTLKDKQVEAISAVYGGSDVFVFLPTGFGKASVFKFFPSCSTTRWVAFLVRMRTVIVISPLVSLMVDQVRTLRRRNIEAVVIFSRSQDNTLVDREFRATESGVAKASLIFSSPESLLQPKWREVLENPLVSSRVCALVINEAHCVSKW